MSYSESEMDEIERDPVRLRGYFWRVAMTNKRLAAQSRKEARTASYDQGARLIHDAEVSEAFSQAILDNLDVLVKSSLVTNTQEEQSE